MNKTETVATIKVEAEKIGTGWTVEKRLAAAQEAKETASPLYCHVLNSYMSANGKAVSVKGLRDDKAVSDETVSDYQFGLACLYRAALNYADAAKEADPAVVKKLQNTLFTEYKSFAHLITGATIKCNALDAADLRSFATSTKRGGTEYETYYRKDGSIATRISKGVAYDAAASLNNFTKAVERKVVERVLGIDGIMSTPNTRDQNAANKTNANAAIAGMSLESASKVDAAA